MIKTKQDLVKIKLEPPDESSAIEVRTANGIIWKLAILSYTSFYSGSIAYCYGYVSFNTDKKLFTRSLYVGGETRGGIIPQHYCLDESEYQFVCFYEDLK